MAKAELKTIETEASVEDFINQVEDSIKREDCKTIVALMEKATGKKAKMWGPSIIGFDKYHYKTKSGFEADMCRIGFSPRKQNLALYIIDDFEKYQNLMLKLGKYKTAKVCLYVKKLSDIDVNILNELIKLSVKELNNKYGEN